MKKLIFLLLLGAIVVLSSPSETKAQQGYACSEWGTVQGSGIWTRTCVSAATGVCTEYAVFVGGSPHFWVNCPW